MNKNKKSLLPTTYYLLPVAQSVVEILIAIAIFTIMAAGIIALVSQTHQNVTSIRNRQEALALAREGLEAARAIRDRNFLHLTNGVKFLSNTGGYWNFSLTPETINGFYGRDVKIDDVYRDDDGNIIPTPGTLDPDTKQTTVTVKWQNAFMQHKRVELSTYLTNWQGTDFLETTCPDFDDGTHNNTESIPLSVDIPPDCQVKLGSTVTDTGFFSSADLGKHATDVVVIDNYAYIAAADQNYGFQVVDVTDKDNPVRVARIDIGYKGNELFIDGDFAYITTNRSGKELAVVNISDPENPSYIAWADLDAPGNGLAVKDGYAYIGLDWGLGVQVVDVQVPSNPQLVTRIGLFHGEDIAIKDNFAFVANSDLTWNELQIIDISTPDNPEIVNELNFGLAAKAIAIQDNYAYISVNNVWSPKLVIVDITDPLNLNEDDIKSEYYFQRDYHNDISVHGDYAYVALDDTNEGLAVIDVSDPENPGFIKNHDIHGKGTGVSANGDYVYATTRTTNKGFVIIGATKEMLFDSGTYISDIVDTGSLETIYRTISWDEDISGDMELKIQLRTSDGDISTATWVGPDGTGTTYYTDATNPSIITLEPGAGRQYFQYKVYFTGDTFSSSALDEIKINYIP